MNKLDKAVEFWTLIRILECQIKDKQWSAVEDTENKLLKLCTCHDITEINALDPPHRPIIKTDNWRGYIHGP